MIRVEDPADQAHVAKMYEAGQGHVFDDWDDLDGGSRRKLLDQVASVDLQRVHRLVREHIDAGPSPGAPVFLPSPPKWVSLDQDPASTTSAQQIGVEALERGEVGVFLVAGGLGTRLGFDGPKGCYPILPVSGGSLFKIFAEKIAALGHRYRRPLPWTIMTSPNNHEATESFLSAHSWFGLSPSDVILRPQGVLPVVDPRQGKILRAGPDQLMVSPDGHGGAVEVMQSLAAEYRSRGIRHLFYHQVDNPLVKTCDPTFLGHHIREESCFSSKAVAKGSPDEKVGVFCQIGDSTRIIEYTELGETERNARDDDGRLTFRAGNIATHLIDLEFISPSGTSRNLELPYHVARKAVQHWQDGGLIDSDTPNSVRFERFIFDLLPEASNTVLLEADREKEFAPVKNLEGDNSPEESARALQKQWADWLEASGIELQRSADGMPLRPIEISPLFATSQEETSEALKERTIPEDGPILLE